MKSASSNNDYYLQHGLASDPFPQGTVDKLFYSTPELNHRLELIKHLLEFSEQLLIITANDGGGKTTLCQHLMTLAEPEWSINLVEGKSEYTAKQLIHEILHDEIGKPAKEVSPSDTLNNYLDYCHRQEKIPIVFIDDAHQLPIETLRFIIQSACVTEAGLRWRVVLFSEAGLNVKLENPQIKSLNTGLFHFIDILPLDTEQTEFYINYRLSRSGSSGKINFSEREIKQIHKVSAGLPGKINHLARQSLIEPALNDVHARNGATKAFFQHKVFIAIAALVLLISGWLLMSDTKQTEVRHKDRLQLPPEETTLADNRPDEEPLTTVSSEEQIEEEPTVVEAETEIVSEEANIPVELTETSQTEEVVAEQISSVPKPAKLQPPAKVIAGGPAVLRGIKGAQWLRTKAQSEYVLQLIGAVEVETISVFVEENDIDTSKLAWFKTKQGGEDWYVLVYGLYPNRDSARADIQSLSPNLKNLHPWPRSIRDIQQAITL